MFSAGPTGGGCGPGHLVVGCCLCVWRVLEGSGEGGPFEAMGELEMYAYTFHIVNTSYCYCRRCPFHLWSTLFISL